MITTWNSVQIEYEICKENSELFTVLFSFSYWPSREISFWRTVGHLLYPGGRQGYSLLQYQFLLGILHRQLSTIRLQQLHHILVVFFFLRSFTECHILGGCFLTSFSDSFKFFIVFIQFILFICFTLCYFFQTLELLSSSNCFCDFFMWFSSMIWFPYQSFYVIILYAKH